MKPRQTRSRQKIDYFLSKTGKQWISVATILGLSFMGVGIFFRGAMNAPTRADFDRHLPWQMLGLGVLVGGAALTGISKIDRSEDRDREDADR
jgi:hypothetical protein